MLASGTLIADPLSRSAARSADSGRPDGCSFVRAVESRASRVGATPGPVDLRHALARQADDPSDGDVGPARLAELDDLAVAVLPRGAGGMDHRGRGPRVRSAGELPEAAADPGAVHLARIGTSTHDGI